MNRFVRDHPSRRRAALARGANRAEENRAHRQIEIGARRHDDGVVAAQFEDGPAKPRVHRSRHLKAHFA